MKKHEDVATIVNTALSSGRAGQFMDFINTLVKSIDDKIAKDDYKLSQNYNQFQYGIDGYWNRAFIAHAATIWLEKHRHLNPRVNDFDFKMSGGRDGKWQVNFIRDIEGRTDGWRANVHVNVATEYRKQ